MVFCYDNVSEEQAIKFVFRMVENRIVLTVDLGHDIGEEPYQVIVTGICRSDCGFERYDVEIMGEYQAGTVGLMELMGYLDSGNVRIVGITDINLS